MNTLLPVTTPVRTTAPKRFACLGDAHGYRFNHDQVQLDAMFTVLSARAHEHQWALQLWACTSAPASNQFTGQLVAQVTLPPIGEIADDAESISVSAAAVPPAGQGAFTMVLALAARCGQQFDEVHDFVVYPHRESFAQPRFTGPTSYRIEDNLVTIDLGGIENPRASENVSGTLAVELWALSEPYHGGAFHGAPLAGVAIDAVCGQTNSGFRSFTLPYTPPPAGNWQVVLMLREWTASGYATRDFINFSVPFVQAATEVVAPKQPECRSTKVSKSVTKTVPSEPASISVNKASAKELAAVKGLPEKVAKGIVAERPFKNLDELTKVKGMGAKLLAKIRAKLKL